jgi:uncharacterized heparinase superfamily protein
MIRLLSMDRHEAAWRAATVARKSVQRAAWQLQRPGWQRDDITSVLSAGELRQAITAAARQNDWESADRVLATHFARRDRRFPIGPSDRSRVAGAIAAMFPHAREEARRRGAAILRGHYDLLGYRGLAVGTPPDWHFDPAHGRRAPRVFWSSVPFLDPSIGDHKVIWELNRHQHWLTLGRAWWLTGDKRFKGRVLDEVHSWLTANPPLMGINWSSMLELALRTISWLWAIHLFADPTDNDESKPWIADLLVALDAQLEHVRHNLSYYFSPNTHLLGEALGLYVSGLALPELKRSSVWRRLGRAILTNEIDRQILPDGGHVERSTHYHRYALDYYLLALAMARITGDVAAVPPFRGAVERLAAYARALTDDSGRLPAIGDDDGGSLFPMTAREPADMTDTLDAAAQLLERPALSLGPAEESLWLFSAWMPIESTVVGPSTFPLARGFDDTGYYTARPSRGTHLIFDVGRHGFLNAGHAHADALSITLTIDGRPLIIDPGTAAYSIDSALRDRFRGTAAHNTLLVDGRAQSEPAGPFQWESRADARPLVRFDEPGFICFEGAHNGFAPLEHRRSVLCVEDLVLVADHLVCVGSSPSIRHTAAAHWHIDPTWTQARRDRIGSTWQLEADGAQAWLATTVSETRLYRGDETSGLGWMSPRYGRIVPATTIVAGVAGTAPLSIVTACGLGSPWRVQAVAPGRNPNDGWCRFGVVLERGRDRIVVLFATEDGPTFAKPGEPIPHPVAPWPTRVVDTDARVAIVRLGPSGDVRALAHVGGTRLRVAALSLAG